MTNEEIDKWVEEHVVITNPNATPENMRLTMDSAKQIAHKFYELGKKEGRKVVDYTAAFEVERKHRDNELPRYYGD